MERIQVQPINKFDSENLGHAEMKIKLTLKNLHENSTKTVDSNSFSYFDSLGWENELLWMLVNFMVNEFGYSKSDVADAFEKVIHHLKST